MKFHLFALGEVAAQFFILHLQFDLVNPQFIEELFGLTGRRCF